MNTTQQKCANMPIEKLGVSAECLNELKKTGVTTVDELADILEQTWGGRAGTFTLHHRVLPYLDEIVDRLKATGCWPDGLDDNEVAENR